MTNEVLPSGTVHSEIPDVLSNSIRNNAAALAVWKDITPLARNEWICLATSAKQAETTDRRLKRIIDQLSRGQRRPCCWTGCPHRTKSKV